MGPSDPPTAWLPAWVNKILGSESGRPVRRLVITSTVKQWSWLYQRWTSYICHLRCTQLRLSNDWARACREGAFEIIWLPVLAVPRTAIEIIRPTGSGVLRRALYPEHIECREQFIREQPAFQVPPGVARISPPAPKVGDYGQVRVAASICDRRGSEPLCHGRGHKSPEHLLQQ